MSKDESKKKSYYTRYIAAGIVSLFIFIAVLIFMANKWHPKPDPASEMIIRKEVAKQLNKDPNELTDEDFAKITDFNFGPQITTIFSSPSEKWPIAYNHHKLSDIKLLEKFINLRILDLGRIDIPENNIPKWMKISAKYGILDIEKRFSIDLNPLKKLIHLQELQLGGLTVKSIKPFESLNNLKTLKLLDTPVSNIKPIKELTNLEMLYFYRVQISNLKPIKNLTNLKALHLIGTQVSDLEPISELINLEHLSLSGNLISDLGPIKELTGLQELLITSTNVSDLEPIKNLTDLKALYLNDLQIYDLKPIENLTKLQRLDIFHCKNISDNQVEDLQKALPNLHIYYEKRNNN